MITQFFDVGDSSFHDRFQAWRTDHQDGVFLTLKTQARANLHGARCTHLGDGPPYFLLEDGFGSLTVSRKVCGSEEELLAWAAENGVRVKRCHHCLRDKLIGNGRAPEGAQGTTLPEEVPSGAIHSEGSVQTVLVNRYERDPRAREECIRRYGATCFICGFDFVAVYGEVMAGFTHVHHLKPLSAVGAGYEVDPVEDLRPVCPNCHAVLHRREPPYSVDEVRELLEGRSA
jgi:5-methylcytosine-specific restriction endonuclease McrA